MVTTIRPERGGFLRPFGCGWFIREYLLGNGPLGSPRIDPEVGAPMVDIHDSYKTALHVAFANDAAARDQDLRVKRGEPLYTEEEYRNRVEFYLSRIPYRLLKMRYSSFTRYFGHLKRLGWVEETGETEPSELQEYYPPAPPRVYYRLTPAGREASEVDWSDPLIALYNYTRAQRSAKRRIYLTRR